MNFRHPIFVDDEPIVVEMMMNLLSEMLEFRLPFEVYCDPDDVAERIDSGHIGSHHIIVVDRFIFRRDSLNMSLPKLFRSLGFDGAIVLFSYVPICFESHGYDGYLKKDMAHADAFLPWVAPKP